jgi:hypothetical protein
VPRRSPVSGSRNAPIAVKRFPEMRLNKNAHGKSNKIICLLFVGKIKNAATFDIDNILCLILKISTHGCAGNFLVCQYQVPPFTSET